MIDIDFARITYFPALRTRQAELKGLEMLNPDRKQLVLPLLTLGRWPRATDFSRAADRARESMGDLPYFIDLTNDGRHLAEQQRLLRNPAGSFEAWRQFVDQYENAIPIVQIPSEARVRDVIRQAQELERSKGRIGFRIREFSSETSLVISAIGALDKPENALVFVDCQYIRNAMSAYVTASVATINQLRNEFPELFIVLVSTSFPASTAPFADASQQRGSIDIQERDLHRRVGGYSVAAYGDHGSIHAVIYDDVPIMRWAARVDYPRELDWYFERRPGNQTAGGYVDAANAVRALDSDIGSRNIWGEEMILRAAGGEAPGAPGPWISIRVNIHLARQIDFSLRLNGEPDDEDPVEAD